MSAQEAAVRRRERYGWDHAAARYDALWREGLAPAHATLLGLAGIVPGTRVLDVACGTGLVALAAARLTGPRGAVYAVDPSPAMVGWTVGAASAVGAAHLRARVAHAEDLPAADASVDVVTCAFGLTYVWDVTRSLSELHRVLRPGGRAAVAVWGGRAKCRWSQAYAILDEETDTAVDAPCFSLGEGDALARGLQAAGLVVTASRRIAGVLAYRDADAVCDAAFLGGPTALAWARADLGARRRARARYLEWLEPWCDGIGYRVPSEFAVLRAERPMPERSTAPHRSGS